ncbi:MAG: hypothetical protein CBC13_11775 [Planctomycetia bacterium TMED53]|nr:MAG: hypothetical protein CBC13_11775 [Planctomycetia bacterium TMED53]
MSTWHIRFRLTRALFSLDIDLSGGERPLALIGANGSGKTTILKSVLGLEKVQDCTIRIGDRVLHDSESGIEVAVEDRNLAYLPQGLGLFPHMSVKENIGFMNRSVEATSTDVHEDEIFQIMKQVGVSQHADKLPSQLSAGERQKVALARLLLQKPGMVLLDEPTSALDILARREVRNILASHLADFAIPTVLVTHDFRDVKQLSADLAYLHCGKIVQQGSLQEFENATEDVFLSEFLAQS